MGPRIILGVPGLGAEEPILCEVVGVRFRLSGKDGPVLRLWSNCKTMGACPLGCVLQTGLGRVDYALWEAEASLVARPVAPSRS